MATLAAPHPLAEPRSRADDLDQVRRLAAIPFLLGVVASFVGLAWDVQWHVDVGPDTFFTAPHLVFYSGVAVTGLTALAVVLLTTIQTRRRGGVPPAGTIPILRGLFHGPAGYVIGGVGAAAFLGYGLLDQWWHGLYGFDVTLISPPHVGLILAILVSMVGALVAFAGDARRAIDGAGNWLVPALGLAVSAGVLVAFVTATFMDAVAMLWPFHGRVDSSGVVIAALYSAILLLVSSVVRRPGIATLTALVFTAIRVATFALIPWITAEYAASIGLFLRDNTSGIAVLPGLMPSYLLLAAVAVDGLLWAGRRWRLSPRLIAPLAGALAAFLLRLTEPVLAAGMPVRELPESVRQEILALIASEATPTLLVVPFVGALFGWLGWQLGTVLRAPSVQPATAAQPASHSGPLTASTSDPAWAD